MLISASVCPCPPWFVNGTWSGKYNWSSQVPPSCQEDDQRVKYYGTVIEYQCPEGFIFDNLPEGYNDTNVLELKCESWADWDPPVQPKCKAKECDDPFEPPGGEKGTYDYEGNNTFSVILTYSCDTPGWGYPSTGLSNVTSLCQADQTWTVKEVEECICKYFLATLDHFET